MSRIHPNRSPRGASGSAILTVTDVAAAKARTDLTSGQLVLIRGIGVYRFVSTQTELVDDESCINVTSGGQLLMETLSPEYMLAIVSDVADALEEAVTNRIVELYRTTTFSSSSATKVTFDAIYPAVELDTLNEYDLVNDKLTSVHGGWYDIAWNATESAGSNTGVHFLYAYRNGSQVRATGENPDATTNLPSMLSASWRIWLDPGDTLEFYANIAGATIAAGEANHSLVIEYKGR